MMKNLVKKLLGVYKLEEEKLLLEAARDRAVAETVRAQEEAELAKLSPKNRASALKEPWVAVLNTHVNQDNIRNGFFELDWNEYFVLKLKQEGYGADGDLDEEVVDRWFRELCSNIVIDGNYGGPVNTGTLDIKNLKQNNQ